MATRILELEVSLEIRKAIESKELNIQSAMTIVKKGMELMDKYKNLSGKEKKDLLIKVLDNISAGNDGIIGTDDDILPQETVAAMRTILDGKLINDIIDTMLSVARGDINIEKISKVAEKSTTVCKGFLFFLPCMKPKVKFSSPTQATTNLKKEEPVSEPTKEVTKVQDVKINIEKGPDTDSSVVY